MKKIAIFIFALIISCFLIFCFNDAETTYAISSQEVAPVLYEFSGDSGYVFEEATPISSMTYGRATLGQFLINGEITDVSSYKNKRAYGVGGIVSFSYTYDGYLQTNNIEEWNIMQEYGTSVNGWSLSGSIGMGALLVQTSSDGTVYYNATNPLTDVFQNKTSLVDFYTASGEDLAQGKYYRIVFAYKTGRKTGRHYDWKKVKYVDDYDIKNNVEVYEFYMCRNDGIISIHNLSTTAEDYENLGYDIEVVKHGETLLDGSTTVDGFKIDKLGSSYLVSVEKDGASSKYAEDGEEFTAAGKYTVTTITKLGKRVSTIIYVLSDSKENYFAEYFGDYIVDGHRVFKDADYPAYAKNSKARVLPIDDTLPMISGYLINETTGETINVNPNRNETWQNALAVGMYSGVINVGDTNLPGSQFRFVLKFEILNEFSAPNVNYNNLYTTSNIEDLSVKHYEVAYQTTLGGYVFVCFALDSYAQAYDYAYEIEGRFLEKAEDGGTAFLATGHL